jgi:hypothetical protein
MVAGAAALTANDERAGETPFPAQRIGLGSERDAVVDGLAAGFIAAKDAKKGVGHQVS